jgi:hypothetical protein
MSKFCSSECFLVLGDRALDRSGTFQGCEIGWPSAKEGVRFDDAADSTTAKGSNINANDLSEAAFALEATRSFWHHLNYRGRALSYFYTIFRAKPRKDQNSDFERIIIRPCLRPFDR